jgi:hypothetical protein
VSEIPAVRGDYGAFSCKLRQRVYIETFGNLDSLIVNMREHFDQDRALRPKGNCGADYRKRNPPSLFPYWRVTRNFSSGAYPRASLANPPCSLIGPV